MEEEMIVTMEIYETIGITPYSFADDESFKEFHGRLVGEEKVED